MIDVAFQHKLACKGISIKLYFGKCCYLWVAVIKSKDGANLICNGKDWQKYQQPQKGTIYH